MTRVKVVTFSITGLCIGWLPLPGILPTALPGLLRWMLGIALVLMGVMAIIPALKR